MQYQNPTAAGIRSWSLAFIWLAINAACPIVSLGCQGDDLKYPYQAIVLSDNANVHSGPGSVHYPTQKLKQGDVVEVYREDPGGWCAIRPLKDSFSLVPEATLEQVEAGVGRVTEDGTQAWVGTMLGAVDAPLWQVKLQQGELVSIIGQVSWPDPRGHSTVWHQIAPPAGEFRWIRIADLQLPASIKQDESDTSTSGDLQVPAPDENTASTRIATRSGIDYPLETGEMIESSTEWPNQIQQVGLQSGIATQNEDTVAINGGWRQAMRPLRHTRNQQHSDRENSNRMTGTYQETDQPSGSGYRVADANVTAPNFAKSLSTIDSRMQNNGSLVAGNSLAMNINDLEMLLTREMLKSEPMQWELTNLENRATSIFRNSADRTERARLERYLDKIANCKEIQAGYRSKFQISSSSRSPTGSKPIGSGILASNELSAEMASLYDANGWLNELKEGGGTKQSSYVLQNSTGKITHHVLAAPGLNLHRYLKSRVGIIGVRGYHNRLKLDHVTAERVIVLEKPD